MCSTRPLLPDILKASLFEKFYNLSTIMKGSKPNKSKQQSNLIIHFTLKQHNNNNIYKQQ